MAAAGVKIVLPTTLTDSSLQVLHDDSILTPGSLFLGDLAHSINPATGYVNAASGVPADGAQLYNVGYKECAALLGSGTAATLAGTLNVKGAIGNLTKGKVERTTKGGLHVIVSQATALAAGDGVVAVLPQAVRTYLKNNTGHAYYFSAWDQLTRANIGSLATTAAVQYEIGQGATPTNLVSVLASTIYANGAIAPVSQSVTGGINTVGARLIALATAGSPMSNDTFTSGGPAMGAAPGTSNNTGLASRNNSWPSLAAYRWYLEDLTVSGRSFATVAALDLARYTAEVATTGGRYNADTFTAPSTIA